MSSSTEGIAPALQKLPLNEQQRAIVAHKHGPLRVIAGPGSGKTRSLTVLAMNLILCGVAKPSEIVLCTYTDKAANELQDRLVHIAKMTDYTGDLSQMRIGTIHSICQQLINHYLHRSPMGNTYETLNQFTQRLFIFEHLGELCRQDAIKTFRRRWGTDWSVAEKLGKVFNTLAEELIFETLWKRYSSQQCPSSKQEEFLYHLTYAFAKYQRLQVRNNCLDFAHLEACAYKLLQEPDILQKVTSEICYVLVDEYQDTNFIQERILALLASGKEPKNLVVIGDQDQALYRFRGATVRNILEFDREFQESQTIYLMTNYRSHPNIIDVCNEWISSSERPGLEDTEATIRPAPGTYSAYPAVLRIQAGDTADEGRQFADLVLWLKERRVISDYSEVALLLHSVLPKFSKAFINALDEKGIPHFCPRARTFFPSQEISLMIGCFARLLRYEEDDQAAQYDETSYPAYITQCKKYLAVNCRKFAELECGLQEMEHEIQALVTAQGETGQKQLADYFYRLLTVEPFVSFLSRDEPRNNLVVFSRILQTFQRHYHYEKMTGENLRCLCEDFISAFLSFLQTERINLDENEENEPFPLGSVPILTIHQSKGLEFAVVVAGRLDALPPNSPEDDYGLSAFYHHAPFEPEESIPNIDRRRLYYVALSRAKHMLVCSTGKNNTADPYFNALWQYAKPWPFDFPRSVRIPTYIQTEETRSPDPRFGFTSHIQTYITCPRRYQYFYDYRFRPSRFAELSFGLLVHQTIERIHRFARDGNFDMLAEQRVREMFDKTYAFLMCSHSHEMDGDEKERAFRMVLNYVSSNQQEMRYIQDAELDFQVERDKYVLVGQIDLIRKVKDGLEIVDFKTSLRQDDSPRLEMYKQQLHLYAHVIKRRTGMLPHKLFLYWMGEERKERALMEVPCQEHDMQKTLLAVDTVAKQIQDQQFEIIHPPERKICRSCDVRHLCRKERII